MDPKFVPQPVWAIDDARPMTAGTGAVERHLALSSALAFV